MSILLQITLVLAMALIIVPLSNMLKLPKVLGYLLTGLILGPSVFTLIQSPTLLHSFIELSLLGLLFWIGLQLRPQRILQIPQSSWIMASLLVFGSTLFFSLMAWAFWQQQLLVSVVIGLAGSLSAMTLVTQYLNDQEQLASSTGQTTYSILLIQALLAIPVLAAIPLFAGINSTEHGVAYFAAIMTTFSGLFLFNHYLMRPLYRWIIKTGSHDLHMLVAMFIMLALLALMHTLGLSLFLGALFAGILLADSDYRQTVESSIQPFKGIVIGLAFIGLGMSLDVQELFDFPLTILAGTAALMLIKFLLGLGLARYYQQAWRKSALLAVSLAQGGEFAFIALVMASTHQLMDQVLVSSLLWMVSLSMCLTPLCYRLLHSQILPRLDRQNHLAATFNTESVPYPPTPVLLIGFGRFGQIIARILRQQQQAFSVMDSHVEASHVLSEYHIPFYQANATEPHSLYRAGIEQVQHVIVAIDDIEDNLLVVRHLRLNYPDMTLWVRVRDRHHVQLLQDLGVERIWRETYASALELGQALLEDLNPEMEADFSQFIQTFRQHDENLLRRQYTLDSEDALHTDRHRHHLAELEYLFSQEPLHTLQPDTQQQQDINRSGIDATRDDLA